MIKPFLLLVYVIVIVVDKVAIFAENIERGTTDIAVRRAQPNILNNARASIPKYLPYICIGKVSACWYAQVVNYIFYA